MGFFFLFYILIYFFKYETIASRNSLSLGYSERDTSSVIDHWLPQFFMHNILSTIGLIWPTCFVQLKSFWSLWQGFSAENLPPGIPGGGKAPELGIEGCKGGCGGCGGWGPGPLSSVCFPNRSTWIRIWNVIKGQLISKGLFKVFICTKKRTKIFLYFCPSL